MRSIVMTLAAAAALAMLPTTGMAADYQLVGFSTATSNGGATISGFTAICQAEFGSTTRMCNSVEMMETVDLTALTGSAAAWVRPVYVAAEAGLEQDASGCMRASTLPVSLLACTGANTGSIRVNPWTSTSHDDYGLVVTRYAASNFSFSAATCDDTDSVACCGPVPEPSMATVPAIMWFGRGLLGAMVLSIAVAGLMYRRQLALGSGGSQIAPRR